MHLFFVTATLCLQMIASPSSMFGTPLNDVADCRSAQVSGKSLLVVIEHARVPNGQLAHDALSPSLTDRDAVQVCRIDVSTIDGARIAASYGATEFPYAVLTDPAGKIVYRGSGLLRARPDMRAATAKQPTETKTAVNVSDPEQAKEQLSHQTVFEPHELADALQTARDAQRMLAVFVTTDACHYCLKMKREALSDPEVRTTVAQQYTSARIDGDKCPDFIEQHGVRMFPTVLVLTSHGQLVDRIEGYVTAEQLASRLRQASSSLISQR